MPTVAMDPLVVDPLSMEHQPTSILPSLSTNEDEDDDINVIKVKARIPSSSSSGFYCESGHATLRLPTLHLVMSDGRSVGPKYF